MRQQFVGTIGIDDYSDDLYSRATHPMSFYDAGLWITKTVEFFQVAIKHDATMREAHVSIYHTDDFNSPRAEPIEHIVLRRS